MEKAKAFFGKAGNIIKKAYTGKLRFLSIGVTAVLFLYLMYFGFCFRAEPTYANKDAYWADVRNVAFHILCGAILFGLLLTGAILLAKQKLTFKKAAVLIALMGGVFVMIYGLSTPIYDYNGLWNQHDLYYGHLASRYYMADRDILDGGGGHFGMIMTVYRHGIIPEIKKVGDSYDFSFGGVLERYQPKLFYLIIV